MKLKSASAETVARAIKRSVKKLKENESGMTQKDAMELKKKIVALGASLSMEIELRESFLKNLNLI